MKKQLFSSFYLFDGTSLKGFFMGFTLFVVFSLLSVTANAQVDLSVVQSLSTTTPNIGEDVVVRITVSQLSSTTAINPVVYYSLPPNFLWSELPPQEYDLTTGTITIPSLAQNASIDYIFTIRHAPDYYCGASNISSSNVNVVPTASQTETNPFNNGSSIPIIGQVLTGAYTPIGTTGASTTISSIFGSGTTQTNKKIILNGSILIDVPINFDGCEFIGMNNSSIQIENGGYLNIRNSHLYSCNTTWSGIFVRPFTNSLDFSNNVIEDARVAINLNYTSPISIKSSVFHDNIEGIHLGGGLTATSAPAANTVMNDNFFSSSANNGQYTGIYIRVSSLNINNCQFLSLTDGIVCINGATDVFSCRFRQIYPFGILGKGIAVLATSPSFSFTNLWVHKTASNTNQNIFDIQDCKIGVWGDNINQNISQQIMNNVEWGVRSNNNVNKTFSIYANEIYCTNVGIEAINNSFLQKSISGNAIRVNMPTPLSPPNSGFMQGVGAAIYIQEAFPSPDNFDMSINNNVITLDNAYKGIEMWGTRGASYFSNSILDQSRFHHYDFMSMAPSNCLFSCNSLYSNINTPSYVSWLYFLAPDNELVCNTMASTNVGLMLLGDCGNTSIHENLIRDIFDYYDAGTSGQYNAGIQIFPGIWIPIMADQDNTANKFMDIHTAAFGASCQDPATNSVDFVGSPFTPQFLIDFSNYMPLYNAFPNLPAQILAPSNDFFYGINNAAPLPLGCFPSWSSEPSVCGSGGAKIKNQEDILTDWDKEFVLYALAEPKNELLHEGKLALFNKLNKHQEWLSENADLNRFYNQYKNTSLHDLIEVRKQVMLLKGNNELSFLLTQQYDKIRENRKAIYENKSGNSSDKVNLQNEILSAQQTIEQLSINAKIKQPSIENVIKLNTSIVPSCIAEQNEKEVNEIYLNTLIQGEMDFSPEQLKVLESIIYQCPIIGGKSVLAARALYGLVKTGVLYNDNEACKENNSDRIAEVNLTNFASASPNPTKDKITFSFSQSTKEPIYITISNIMGQEMLRYEVPTETLMQTIDVHQWNEGIYYYSISNTKTSLCANKFVVTK